MLGMLGTSLGQEGNIHNICTVHAVGKETRRCRSRTGDKTLR
jgi:hypothetical protein